MTLTLADQSSLPPLPGWALALGVIAGLAAIAYLFLGPLVHRAPLQDADTSRLDALDGVGRCAHILCDEPAQVHVHAGHDWYRFCLTHGLPHLRDGFDQPRVMTLPCQDCGEGAS